MYYSRNLKGTQPFPLGVLGGEGGAPWTLDGHGRCASKQKWLLHIVVTVCSLSTNNNKTTDKSLYLSRLALNCVKVLLIG